MLDRKANLYVLLCIVLTACTKQTMIPNSSLVSDSTISLLLKWPWQQPDTTIFGLIEESATTDQTKADMKTANVNLIRIPIFLSETTVQRTADDYLSNGYNVQLNVNWYSGTNGSRTFPSGSDTNLLKTQADAFFKYYAPRKSQIPFVTIENEWDYEVQNGAVLQDYLRELAIVTAIGHKYGFKISDGGITSGTLQRWTYSQLTGQAQINWGNNYYIGLNNGYDSLMSIVNTYIATAKSINFDYSNVHWYNSMICGNGFGTASKTFAIACNKTQNVCNEFGIRTSLTTLFGSTVNEIKGNAKYAVAYSGTGTKGKAVKLTDSMLALLH